ncbi:RNA polymerase sigma factor [Spirosoma utsteinense]|uniref:RNA polymerase sigma-70 factor (ECF subfamily) n=1 Tax=Spirosoma utsteinense TaxID=2585773 RepID=A0ABR6WEY7_9BACT|nr:sigma-70 family RNA polymerase sigma factor [Spirosoma utsteinense]MBC3789211.1 RNA polymerase sigma-70 factor (ECF subfamily) [Spirosoma utsteinense]MBC3795121.1 RNA polymerase sigma-70 factor (ECF subfamily) [Spirosoma utsteinense]
MTSQLTATQHTQLWDTFRSGDRAAFSQLYEWFSANLYRYGYNLIRNRQLVEDCLHELFLHLHENRGRLGPTDNIRFYLYRALRRRLLDTVTRLNKLDSDPYFFDKAEFVIQPYERFLIDEQILDRQKHVLIHELNKLPKRQKEILYLVYMKGLSYLQAAEVMDITIKSVYNTVNVALKTLRAHVRVRV